jgi:hypothetical protein
MSDEQKEALKAIFASKSPQQAAEWLIDNMEEEQLRKLVIALMEHNRKSRMS